MAREENATADPGCKASAAELRGYKPLAPLIVTYVDTAFGAFGLCGDADGLTRILFPGERPPDGCVSGADEPLEEAARQLSAYFEGTLKTFDVPLKPSGTPFMRSVWDALMRIPYGDTTTYGALARALGKPNAARAVGMACARNPIPIIVPCHRVVGHTGKLTGFAGGVELKERLLALERACVT